MEGVEVTANTDLTAEVARASLAQKLLTPDQRVLVAFSGGSDSTALASILAEAKGFGLSLGLILGHVDHGWRGADASAADRAQVKDLGARLGLPVACSPPPPKGTPQTEDAARRYRYGWLGRAAREHGCTAVAVGHHLGDQAETFLMRLLRGSGAVGLAGIPRSRPLGGADVTVVRPLLDVDPLALRRHLEARGLSWRDDPTNEDGARDRARIRARIDRLLETQPDARARLARHATRLRRRLQVREAEVVALAADRIVAWPWAGAVSMPRAWLRGLRDGLTLALALRAAGREVDADRDGPWLTRRHVRKIADVVRDGGAIDLPRGLCFRAVGSRAWLRRVDPLPRALPALRVQVVSRRDVSHPEMYRATPAAASLDADALGRAPVLRRLREDDRFAPFGGSGRVVRVRDWLSKQGIPAFAREGTLVVEGDAGVAWVVGMRIDQQHAIATATERVARLEVRQT